MKKIIVAIAILMLMHFAALGVLAALYPVNPLFDRTYDGRPEVECFEFSTGGGLAGHFRYSAKIWQDGAGYHLYYKEYEKPDKTFSLTKLEYLQCTGFSRADAEAMAAFEGARIADGFYTTVRIKFKGSTEIKMPAKSYDGNEFGSLMSNVRQIVSVKQDNHENDPLVKLNNRLSNYSLKNNVDFYTLSYRKKDRKSEAWNNSLYFSKGILFQPRQIYYFRRDCARSFVPEECTVFDFEGQKAYIRAFESDDTCCFYIYLQESRDEIVLISSKPKEASLEEYKRDFCSMMTDTSKASSRDKAVMIEVAAFLAVTFMTVVIMYIIVLKTESRNET